MDVWTCLVLSFCGGALGGFTYMGIDNWVTRREVRKVLRLLDEEVEHERRRGEDPTACGDDRGLDG